MFLEVSMAGGQDKKALDAKKAELEVYETFVKGKDVPVKGAEELKEQLSKNLDGMAKINRMSLESTQRLIATRGKQLSEEGKPRPEVKAHFDLVLKELIELSERIKNVKNAVEQPKPASPTMGRSVKGG
jgi:hypothetical protein